MDTQWRICPHYVGVRLMDWFEDWLQRAIEKLAAWLENKK
jgi:hypothetical protein